MSPINFPHKNLEGLDGFKRMGWDDNLAIALVLNTAKQDGCKRMGLDDTLAISIVFNTTKQIHPDFKKTFFWSSENQKNQEKWSKK
jgi:hypothetical protein